MTSTTENRHLRLIVLLLAMGVGLLIPFKILSLGYLPMDDALRHAAKAVSGKVWSDILVLNPAYAGDEHPGWHAILGGVYKVTGCSTDALVSLAVAGLFCALWLAFLAGQRRPDAVLYAILICIFFTGAYVRWLFGRPFILMDVCIVVLLRMWGQELKHAASCICSTCTAPISKTKLGITFGVFAVSAWIHESWYLYVLLLGAFFLVGRLRDFAWLLICWIFGTLAGALLTGHPFEYLWETFHLVWGAIFPDKVLQRMTTIEFQPSSGDASLVIVVGLMLLWRKARGAWRSSAIYNPTFALAVVGWVLGLRVCRFWADWGYIALTVWVIAEITEALEDTNWEMGRIRSVGIAGLAGLSILFTTTQDSGSRWTNSLNTTYLTQDNPAYQSWLPGTNGIIYSADMRVFYNTFYKNPNAPWKYVLGFEPTIMDRTNLTVLRDIQVSFGSDQAYTPWVKKMHPEDRLVILDGPGGKPNIPVLQWNYITNGIWIGKTKL